MIKWGDNFGGSEEAPSMLVKRLLHLFGCRIDLHKFLRPDLKDCYHDHPAYAIRIVLWGGYVEEIFDEAKQESWYEELAPGYIGLVRPEFTHRIHELRNGKYSYSLWLRGPIKNRSRSMGLC